MSKHTAFTGFGEGEIVDRSDDEVKVQYPNGTTYNWLVDEVEIPDWEIQLNQTIEELDFECDTAVDTADLATASQQIFSDLDDLISDLFPSE
jgi:hypothetical protein